MTYDEACQRAVEAAKKVLFDRKIVDTFSVTAAVTAYERVMADAGWRMVRVPDEARMLRSEP